MKAIITLLLTLLWLGNSVQAQENIYYNYQSKHIEDAKGNEIEQYSRNTKYKLFVKNYNPALYKAQASVTQKNSFIEGLQAIMNFIGEGKLPSHEAAAFLGNETTANRNDPKTILITNFKKAKYLSARLQDPDVTCDDLKSLVNNGKDELLNSFFAYTEQDTIYKNNNKLDAELKITIEEVERLNALSNQILKFTQEDCATELLQFTATKTEVTLTVKLTPVDEKSSLNIVEYSETKSIKGKLYASFSTGVMLTNVVRKGYYTKDVSATEFKIVEEDKAKVLPGVMALIHITTKEDAVLSLNVGVGIDIDKTPHFLLGPSFNLFDSTFIISGGLDLGYLEEITDKYNTNDTYSTKPEIAYKKNLLTGYWVGLTYKL